MCGKESNKRINGFDLINRIYPVVGQEWSRARSYEMYFILKKTVIKWFLFHIFIYSTFVFSWFTGEHFSGACKPQEHSKFVIFSWTVTLMLASIIWRTRLFFFFFSSQVWSCIFVLFSNKVYKWTRGTLSNKIFVIKSNFLQILSDVRLIFTL